LWCPKQGKVVAYSKWNGLLMNGHATMALISFQTICIKILTENLTTSLLGALINVASRNNLIGSLFSCLTLHSRDRQQGCQMVYFQTKTSQFRVFL
jgi:hypothetical protein